MLYASYWCVFLAAIVTTIVLVMPCVFYCLAVTSAIVDDRPVSIVHIGARRLCVHADRSWSVCCWINFTKFQSVKSILWHYLPQAVEKALNLSDLFRILKWHSHPLACKISQDSVQSNLAKGFIAAAQSVGGKMPTSVAATLLGMESVSLGCWRLKWFGHVERQHDIEWIVAC